MRSAIALAAIAIIVGAFLLIHALSVEADFLCSKYSVTASGVNYYTPGYTKVINIADVAAKELSVSLRVKSQARMFVIVYEEWDGGIPCPMDIWGDLFCRSDTTLQQHKGPRLR